MRPQSRMVAELDDQFQLTPSFACARAAVESSPRSASPTMMHHSFQQPPSPHDGGGGDGGGVDPSLSVPSRRRVQLPVAELIESATNEFLAGQPDWSANMAVVDRLTHMPQEYGRHDRRECT